MIIIFSPNLVYSHTPTYDQKGFPERVDCFAIQSNGTCNVDIIKIEQNFSGWGDDQSLIDWTTFSFEPKEGVTPIAGDWDGDGKDTIGLYQPSTGTFFLKNSNEKGSADLTFSFGPKEGVTPIAGDWDGDGKDTIGLYQKSNRTFFLTNVNNGGDADLVFPFGPPQTQHVLVGDWNSNGIDNSGVYFDSNFLIRLTNDIAPNLWKDFKIANFLPSQISVNRGVTVIWENHDDIIHNISGLTRTTVENQGLNKLETLLIGFSEDIRPGEQIEIKFPRSGTFHYFDKYFPELQGMIIVFEENLEMNVETELVYSIPEGDLFFQKMITGIAFAPDGKMFFTEHEGDVKIMENGILVKKPFLTKIDKENFPQEDGKTPLYENKFPVESRGWRGITLDPNYEDNHYVYLTRLFKVIDGIPYEPGYHNQHTQLVRVTDVNNTATDLTILIDDVPGREHAGGIIVFGDDDKIYFSTGDNALSVFSQDISKLTGKILRINPDGSIPDDNPFPNNPVFTYGHREVFGLAKHPETGNLYSIDNGPYEGDEINLLQPGGNYGWPVYSGNKLYTETMVSENENYIPPLKEWSQVLGPTNAIFYTGDRFPILQNNLLVGTWNLGMIKTITFESNYENIASEKLLFSGYKPVVAIAESPDGYIYFSTMNSIEKIISVNSDSLSSPTTAEIRSLSIIVIIIVIIAIISWIVLKRRKLKR